MSVYRFVIASALTIAVFLATAAPAEAGQYIVYSCKTPSGKVAPTDGWTQFQNSPNGSATDSCASGGVLGTSLSGNFNQPEAARIGWRFTAPAGTSIDYFNYWRSAVVNHSAQDNNASPVTYTSFRSSNFYPDVYEWCGVGCSSQGIQTSAVVPENAVWSGNLTGVNDVYFLAGCQGTNNCPTRNSSSPMADIRVQAFQANLRDDSDPTVDSVRGTLTESGSHSGVESISFNAKDKGSGLYHSFVEVRKAGELDFTAAVTVPVDTNGGKCVELDYWAGTDREFGWRVPCKLIAAEALDLDTAKLPDGTYELRVRVEDAAGNDAIVHGPRSFKVDNKPGSQPGWTPTSLPGATGSGSGGSGGGSTSGGSGPVSVSASNGSRLVLNGASRRSLAFGRSTEVAATLRDGAGRPISGASVAVMERMSVPGAKWAPARAPLTTNADGRVRWTAPPSFSRRIRLAYRANPADASDLASTDLALTVRSKTTLKGSRAYLRNGGTLRFVGRLLSRPVPRGGVVVELQAQVKGRWVTFNTRRTGSDGRWKASYRFHATSGLQTYRFRARIRRDTGFPYEPSLSRRISVRVRG